MCVAQGVSPEAKSRRRPQPRRGDESRCRPSVALRRETLVLDSQDSRPALQIFHPAGAFLSPFIKTVR